MESKEILVLWKDGSAPVPFGGLGGIEENTCLVEGWLGPRNDRGLVESKEIPVVCSMSNSNFTIFSGLSGLFPQTFSSSRNEAVVCAGSSPLALRGLATCNGF